MDNKSYWEARELIVIGTFAALIKVSSLLIALAGGGMNPVTLALKNTVATMLLIVLVFKVRKFGVLTLYVLVSAVFSILLMGGNFMLLPGNVLAGLACDLLIVLLGGYQKTASLFFGIAFFDLSARVLALGYSFLTMREDPRMLIMPAVIVVIGYLGCLIGLPSGVLFVKELRHAGIIRN